MRCEHMGMCQNSCSPTDAAMQPMLSWQCSSCRFTTIGESDVGCAAIDRFRVSICVHGTPALLVALCLYQVPLIRTGSGAKLLLQS